MNRIIKFFISVIVLTIVFVAMFFTGAIFDAAKNTSVKTYFFQVDNFSYQRPGEPLNPKQLGDSQLFDLLVQKYVTEYLYVLPDVTDIEHRESNKGPLHTMSMQGTFDIWQKNYAPAIREMAEKGMLRTVFVSTPLKYGDFYQVEFELKTWEHPNDISAAPTVSAGLMQFKLVMFDSDVNEEKLTELHSRLEKGYDPVGVFDFRISDVTIHMEQ